MPRSLLQRIKRILPNGRPGTESFQLPGLLHEGVRVLLVDSGDLTDLLFAMPFVEELRQRFPTSHLGLLCGERTSHLALSCDCFQDLVVHGDGELRGRSAEIRKLEEVLAADPWELAVLVGREPDPVREALAMVSGAALRLGPGHPGAWPHVNCELRAAPEGHYPYRRTATWGRLLGVPLEGVALRWPLQESKVRQMAQLVHFNKPQKDQLLIGVDCGEGKEGTILAAENWAFLVNHLTSHVRCKVILLSADPDPTRAGELSGRLRGERLDLPRPTLQEVVVLLAQCDLFLSGNTDLFHFATALDVPTLGIFTEQDGRRWVPERASRLELLRSREGEELRLDEFMDRVDRLLA